MSKTIDKLGTFLLRWRVPKKILAIIFVVLFAISLIPIVITCFYSVPVLDDYDFGLKSHLAYVHGRSFFGGVLESCNFFYNNWQGVYTSNFIASIQPFNMNVDLYWISNIVVLFSVCFSMFFFLKVVLINTFYADKWDYLLISIPIVTLFLQFMPGIQEGIYWMDGSLSLLVNSVYLVVFSLVILYHLSKKPKGKIFYAIISIILVLLFSGTSYLCFVTCLMLTTVSTVYCIYKKIKTYRFIILLQGIYTVGIIITILAPGNAVRMNGVSALSFPHAIIKALVMSVYYFGEWSNLVFIAALIFISIVFYNIAKHLKYQFKNPLLVFVICYLIYAGRMSVQYYAIGSIGAWRQLNEYYLGFLICISLSVLYFVGWLSKRPCTNDLLIKNNKSISVVFVLIIAFAFVAGTINYGYDHNVSSASTTISLVKGETQQYNKEMKDRIKLFEESKSESVVVKPLSVYPSFFVPEPLSTEQDYWTNSSTAKYYEVDSIALADD